MSTNRPGEASPTPGLFHVLLITVVEANADIPMNVDRLVRPACCTKQASQLAGGVPLTASS
jgi:hypothetical protein